MRHEHSYILRKPMASLEPQSHRGRLTKGTSMKLVTMLNAILSIHKQQDAAGVVETSTVLPTMQSKAIPVRKVFVCHEAYVVPTMHTVGGFQNLATGMPSFGERTVSSWPEPSVGVHERHNHFNNAMMPTTSISWGCAAQFNRRVRSHLLAHTARLLKPRVKPTKLLDWHKYTALSISSLSFGAQRYITYGHQGPGSGGE